MNGFILEKRPISVKHVPKDLKTKVTSLGMKKFIQVKNHMNVKFVCKVLVPYIILKIMRQFTQVNYLIIAKCVIEDLD